MTRMRLAGEPALPAKITVRAGGRKVVLAKQAGESARHILLKALVFGLYVPDYPDVVIEPRFHQRYRPDLLHLDPAGQPTFWAECGVTGRDKLLALIRTYPATHLVVAKQLPRIESLREAMATMVAATRRSAPVDLVNVPADADRFIGPNGEITVTFQDVARYRFPPQAQP